MTFLSGDVIFSMLISFVRFVLDLLGVLVDGDDVGVDDVGGLDLLGDLVLLLIPKSITFLKIRLPSVDLVSSCHFIFLVLFLLLLLVQIFVLAFFTFFTFSLPIMSLILEPSARFLLAWVSVVV